MDTSKKTLTPIPTFDENDYRFPTFQIDGIDQHLNNISKENLLEDYKICLEKFTVFFEQFDYLLNMENPISIPIRETFKKNGLILSSLRISYYFLNRKIQIFSNLFNNKNLEETKEEDFLNIMKDFINKNSSSIYVNDIEQIKLDFNNQKEKIILQV